MMRQFVLSALAAVAFAMAAEHPNFSGKWVLDAAKSDFGNLPPPVKYERAVKQQGDAFQVTTQQATAQGEQTITTHFNAKGQPEENQLAAGAAQVIGRWSGDGLAVDTQRAIQGQTITSHESWVLSPDRKQLTITNHIQAPQGPLDLRVVMRRQE